MANVNNADSNNHLSVDTLPHVPKDVQGSPNPIPLSPQWLLSKPGENKHGMESHPSQYPGHTNHSDFLKSSRNDEEFYDTEKRRDAYKPSLHDVDSGRRDRWRDEERDTNSALRRDRWREADNELGDTRKMERWVDASGRHSGEPRRVPSDRWSDSSNKDGNYDHRRESKWNTRWGPDDKESESGREKWLDSSRDGEVPRGKTLVHLSNHGKEEREGDHYRPWRSSSLQNRGRGEPLHHQPLTPNKQAPTFSYGRGRGENAPPTFSSGRGKVIPGGSTINAVSSHSHSFGALLVKDENAHRDSSPLKYSRNKLLDIYRITEMRSYRKPLEEFIEVPPSLTQSDPLEPLALCAPTHEELVIMKGIDKGDVVSSGTPQVSKDGSTGRDSADVLQTGQGKLGSREDLPSSIDDYKEQNTVKHAHFYASEMKSEASQHVPLYSSEPKSEAIQNHHMYHEKSSVEGLRANSTPHKRAEEGAISREVSMQGISVHPSTPWRSQSLGDRLSHDWREIPAEIRSRTSELGWSNVLKDRETLSESSSAVASSYHTDELKWNVGEGFHSDITHDSVIKRQLSEVLDREREARKVLPHPSPEDLLLYYKDPQGEIQGPFSGGDLIGWFDAGYFGIDLQVRLVSASPDTPFSLLGDVMPHLRAKARPPPGFSVPKQSEMAEAIIRQKVSSIAMPLSSSSEIDVTKVVPRNRHESVNEAENRFLESLMSSNVNISPLEKISYSEGFQGYMGNKSAGMPMMGIESGNDLNYLLAQKMTLERQRSMPNPHSYWPGRDAAPMVPKTDIMPESPSLHSKLLPSMSESPHLVPLSQNVELTSILQGVTDKSTSSAVNNGVPGWSSFPVQGGLDMRQDKLDVNHGQRVLSQAAYGVPQQRIQQQNQQSLTNTVPQDVDHPSSVVTQGKLLSSGLSQDPQMLSLLQQQQFMLSQLQLQSQAPVPMQLSLLDKLILLKQQQKQEQQQQLLLQQQQHLLSQVLSEHQSHQRFSEPYGHVQNVAMPSGNDPIDHLVFRPPHELLHINNQMPLSNLQGGITAGVATLPSQVSQDVEHRMSSEGAQLHLPHRIFENSNYNNTRAATMMEQINESQQKDSLQAKSGNTPLPEVMGSSQESSVLQKHEIVPDSCAAVAEQILEDSRTDEPVTVYTSEAIKGSLLSDSPPGITDSIPKLGTSTDEVLTSESTENLRASFSLGLEEIPVQKEQFHSEAPLMKEARSAEVREGKKASDKKSRKQKNAKAQTSSDQAKGASSTHPLQQSKHLEVQGVNLRESRADIHVVVGEQPCGTPPLKNTDTEVRISSVDSEVIGMLSRSSSSKVETLEVKDELREVDSLSLLNPQANLGHRAWKPAPSIKAKSLLEIQQEEKRVAQTEVSVSDGATSINLTSSSMPWAGVVANSEPKRDSHQGASTALSISGRSDNLLNAESKKSQLHDLLAEEVLAKSDERAIEAPDSAFGLPSTPIMNTPVDSTVYDGDFIQAKENKKSRKKSVKGKGVAVMASNSVPLVDVASSPIERSKSSRQAQQEKEVLPPLPSGPSLGDFVLWKGESANPPQVPAWSAESGKLSKPTSLRDIQKEQEKKVASVPHQTQSTTPQKVPTTRGSRGTSTSWTLAGSSPSKSASPIQINSVASTQSKSKGEDDLFWGPLDQSKQETKQSDFPFLSNAGGGGYKSTPVKGILGGSSSRQKSIGRKSTDYSLSPLPAGAQSFHKGRKEAITKHTEAMDFRAWCENETARLTGSKDTSFLEFCLKQSTSEAETLLIENLGSFDSDHIFIDKFLNYKELLSADVLEIAFQARNDSKATRFDVRDVKSDNMGIGDLDLDMAAGSNDKGGGKKKGKKGKKVNPSVLGFNVVSNRVMMGEIQTVED